MKRKSCKLHLVNGYKYIGFLLLIAIGACSKDKALVYDFPEYKTKNVVVIVIDGPRYSETWGEQRRGNIPVRNTLLEQGVMVEQFFNGGVTFTNPGHSALMTGNYENLANNGTQMSNYPGMFQQWIQYRSKKPWKAFIITSKDKLWILGNTNNILYKNKYRPYIDCGVNQNGTGGYRADSITLAHVLYNLKYKKPEMLFINFKDPDTYGHAADSANYIKAIQKTDEYVGIIWDYLQSDPKYKDCTTLIVTNDHGRHFDGHLDGFVSHGDNCSSCRRIELFAISPDFKKNKVIETPYQQIDVPATISQLMGFPMPYGKGKVMWDLFE